ncbi:DUF2625 family protein [Actinoplanes sp. ATCC 53533]|uniref:DUF2625 family protein n=1 Tax=Actinoplanes sp. ATCC 53533 TaxID=1288362 RepID=UPI0013152D4E
MAILCGLPYGHRRPPEPADGLYESLRWQGWADQVATCRLDHAINVLRPLWTRDGKDLDAASRRPIPMSEAIHLIDVSSDGLPPS